MSQLRQHYDIVVNIQVGALGGIACWVASKVPARCMSPPGGLIPPPVINCHGARGCGGGWPCVCVSVCCCCCCRATSRSSTPPASMPWWRRCRAAPMPCIGVVMGAGGGNFPFLT